MRCKTILSLNNNLFKTRIHATKSDALEYKQGILKIALSYVLKFTGWIKLTFDLTW